MFEQINMELALRKICCSYGRAERSKIGGSLGSLAEARQGETLCDTCEGREPDTLELVPALSLGLCGYTRCERVVEL